LLHRTDPRPPWRAAVTLGRLVAAERSEADATLAAVPAPCNAALDEIAAGPALGQLYAVQRGGFGGNGRWVGNVLIRAGLAEGEAARVVATWLCSGLLIETEYRDPVHRRARRGVRVVDGKRPTVSNRKDS
jgi:hypothetical protein